MMQLFTRGRRCAWLAGLAVVFTALPVLAQDNFRGPVNDPNNRNDPNRNDPQTYRRPQGPSLSESTAILEAAVRAMYMRIEPGNDTSPNELLVYADLRALRLYTGALEVAGWSLEQSQTDFYKHQAAGAYRNGYSKIQDHNAETCLARYRAYRESCRTLLYRVRTTSVSVEHQVTVCAPEVAREWREQVLPALRDLINATEPMFEEQIVYTGYVAPGGKTVQAGKVQLTSTGIPEGAAEVNRNRTYKPYNGEGRGMGRYIEVRAYGGGVQVASVRFRSHERAAGAFDTSVLREVAVDQIAEPGRPLYIPANRGRTVDMSDLEIVWDNADRNRRCYATVELVEANPNDRN